MIENDWEGQAPVSFAGGVLDPYRHVCAFVNGPFEAQSVFDQFVSEGLMHGEKVTYVVAPGHQAGIVRHLRHLGFEVSKLLGQRVCEVLTWSETYLRGGRFDQDTMLNLLDEMLGACASPRIRLVIDMGWAADLGVTKPLLEYESRGNYVQPKFGHISICVYDTAKFSADVIIDVLRTHPMALIGGVLQINPFFTPMTEFLEEIGLRYRDEANEK